LFWNLMEKLTHGKFFFQKEMGRERK